MFSADKPSRDAADLASAASPDTAASSHLKHITANVGANGRYIQIHFVTDQSQVTTIQLETNVATGLQELLGRVLASLKRTTAVPPRLN